MIFKNLNINSNNQIIYKNKILYEEISKSGYVYVKIKNKKYRKHRLIWEIFNDTKIPKGYFINHIDGNKQNNNINNLELNTPKENTIHWYKNINKENLIKNFDGKKIVAYNIFTLKKINFNTISEAAKTLNISDKLISAVLKNKQKTTNSYIFSYNDIDNIEEYIKKTINIKKINDNKKRKVICKYKDGKKVIFNSVLECADFFSVRSNSVRRWCDGSRKNKDGIDIKYL